MGGGDLFLDAAATFQAVHDGHHYVADYKVWNQAHGFGESFAAVAGLVDFVFAAEEFADEGADVGVVVDDKERGASVGVFLRGLHALKLGGDIGVGNQFSGGFGPGVHVGYGDGDGEDGAFSQGTVGGDCPSVEFDKSLHQRQTDA